MRKLQDAIFETAKRFADKVCLKFYQDGHWTDISYSEFKTEVESNAVIIQNLGVQQGNRVLLITENSPAAMIAFFSILHSQAIPVLIDPSLPIEDLKNLITTAATALTFISDKYWNELDHSLFENQMVRNINKNLACVKEAPLQNFKDTQPYDADIAAILFTSGTTGSSKGAMLTHQNFMAGLINGEKAIEITTQDRMLSILPIHHISPLIQNLLSLYAGSTLICIDKMDVTTLFAAMQGSKPTILGVVPLLLELFLKNIEAEIAKLDNRKRKTANFLLASSQKIRAATHWNVGFHLFSKVQKAFAGHLKKIVCGGAALDPNVLAKMEGFGFTIVEAYGLTETTGPACANPLKGKKLGTVGIPFNGLHFQIENPDEKGEGEISISGSQIIKGYCNFETDTLKNGKLLTGDRGFIDSDGFLKITGRMREMITLSSGKKLFPVDIEKYYEGIEGVKELAVFGVSSINAAIVFDDEFKKTDTLEQLTKATKHNIFERGKALPTHFQIQQIFVVDSLPKTSLFKVKRTQLNQLLKKENAPIVPAHEKNNSEIEQWMMDWIANKTNSTRAKIDKHEPFVYFGLDSLTMVTFCEELEAYTHQKVNPTLIWSYPTIEKLAAYLSKTEVNGENDGANNSFSEEPLAIVGMACKFPGDAETPEQFWQLFKEGKSGIKEVPKNRWDNDTFYDADEKQPGKINSRHGGFIKNIDQFDAKFFEISPVEAENMDPQQRILLETTWEALERSGIDPTLLMDTPTSCYIGISTNDYGLLQNQAKNITPYYGIGNALSAAAGRIAYFLGLKGVCKTIDTACSSSLVALHEACQSLQRGDTQLAIVGGVNSIISPFTSISFSKAKMLAPDGKCKVFDADANGYVRSEGCGVVIVKRLSDAQKDRNPILAIIAATGVNHDGRTNGITAPSGESQAKLYKRTLASAGISPEQVDYVEAHGTGTTLGDPIEVRSISEVYAKNRSSNLFIGSAKSHIGHLEAAAGMAGLIKTILVLNHQTIPAQIHLQKMNPYMEIDGLPVEIPLQNHAWNVTDRQRIAAVSAFGFTGTNAHIILKEANRVENQPSQSAYFVPLSAKTETALKQKTQELAAWLEAHSDVNLENLSYTLSAGRSHFQHRAAFIASSIQELQNALKFEKSPLLETKNAESEKLLKLKEIYLSGAKIEWESLWETRGQKIPLPTYPFERQAFWLKFNSPMVIETKNFDINEPFGMNQLISPRVKDVIYEGEICESYPGFIKDHQVYEMPIVAGAVYLASIVSLVKKQYQKEFCLIENFRIAEPLIVQKENVVVQTLFAEPKDNQISFEFVSRQKENQQWRTHSVGSLQLEAGNALSTQITLADAKQICSEDFSSERLYQIASDLKLYYGPTFKYLSQIWLGSDAVLGKLNPASGLTPGLIDSCLQVLFAYISKQPINHLAVPVSIKKFYLRNNQEEISWVLAKNIQLGNHQMLADFYLFNSQEEMIGEISGFVAKEAQKEMLLRHVAKPVTDAFYKINLKNMPLVAKQQMAENAKWLIVSDDPSTFDGVIHALNEKNETQVVADFNSLQQQLSDVASTKGIIFYYADSFLELNASDLSQKYREKLATLVEFLQGVVKQKLNLPTLWFIIPDSVFYSPFTGMLKTLLLEFPSLMTRIIELDEKPVSQIYVSLIHVELTANSNEQHVLIKNGIRQVERLEKIDLQRAKSALRFDDKNHYRLNIKNRGLLQNLMVEEITWPVQLAAKQVAVEVKATGLNFRDVLNVLGLYPGDPGELGSDFSGIVTAIGSDVKSLKVGDEVCGFVTSGGIGSHAVGYEQFITKKAKQLSFNAAATIPAAFLTAHLALTKLAKIKAGDKVLIHAAAGGVGIAAIQIAQRAGAIVFATAGSDVKRQFLRNLGVTHIYDSRSILYREQILADTQNKGVDIVLNSLSGPFFIENTVASCAEGARFLEIGKRDIWSKEKMQSERADIDYHIIALDELMKNEPDFIPGLFNELMPLFANNELQPLPVVPFHMEQAIDAFRYMQQAKHIGKIVIQQPVNVSTLNPKGSYLITGGLGGIGLKVTQWLIEKGAKHLVLIGRSLPKDSDKNKLAQLAKNNVTILTYQVDVTDESQLNELMKKFGNELPDLKGIIHAAGVLDDAMFVSQTWQQFEKVFAPKIRGAWNLHQLTLKQDLDFFILFSSVASVLGSPGQANYAAANTFLDQLALYRRKSGLRANSVNWGPWAEVGMASHLRDQHAKKGMNALDPDQALALLDGALKQDLPQILIASMIWEKLQKELPPLAFLEEIAKKAPQAPAAFQFPNVKEAKESERLSLLQDGLRQGLAGILGLDASQIENDSDFFQLGMDSLMALELRALLENHLGANILDSETMEEFPTIEKLSTYLCNQLTPKAETVETNAPVVTEVVSAPAPVVEVIKPVIQSSLSQEELAKIDKQFAKLTQASFYNRIVKQAARKIFFTACKHYFKMEVDGLENLPKEGPFIICANHSSYLDGVALRLATNSDKLVGLFAQEYYHKPVYPWMALISDTVPFDRTPNESALQKNLKYIELCQNANKTIVIFPEGTRSKDGTLQEFKNGVAWFAHRSKLKIVPAFISGAAKLMPRGSAFPKPGTLSVSFGKPTDFSSNSGAGSSVTVYQEFTQKLRKSILELSH